MDIDLDFPPSFNPRAVMPQAIPASMVKNNDLVKHPCGHYLQTIPVDKVTGLAAIPFEEAEVLGYFKIDFLTLHLLSAFKSKEEIRKLSTTDPDWSLLQKPHVVENLFHVKNHYRLLSKIKPQSVQELADCLALIRPAKKHLVDAYLQNKNAVRKELYVRPESDGYYFKKSHAISYALTIVLQLHLVSQGRL